MQDVNNHVGTSREDGPVVSDQNIGRFETAQCDAVPGQPVEDGERLPQYVMFPLRRNFSIAEELAERTPVNRLGQQIRTAQQSVVSAFNQRQGSGGGNRQCPQPSGGIPKPTGGGSPQDTDDASKESFLIESARHDLAALPWETPGYVGRSACHGAARFQKTIDARDQAGEIAGLGEGSSGHGKTTRDPDPDVVATFLKRPSCGSPHTLTSPRSHCLLQQGLFRRPPIPSSDFGIGGLEPFHRPGMIVRHEDADQVGELPDGHRASNRPGQETDLARIEHEQTIATNQKIAGMEVRLQHAVFVQSRQFCAGQHQQGGLRLAPASRRADIRQTSRPFDLLGDDGPAAVVRAP